jgi:UDP-glucuronate decarboxylase
MALMDSDVTGPVNLGNPVEYTMQELAARIIKKTGSKAGIRIEPLPQDDPKQRRPDIGLANSALGWHPKVLLDNGLDATINHFRAVI